MKLQHQEEWSIGNLKRRVNQADPNQDLTTNPEKVSRFLHLNVFRYHMICHMAILESSLFMLFARSHCEG